MENEEYKDMLVDRPLTLSTPIEITTCVNYEENQELISALVENFNFLTEATEIEPFRIIVTLVQEYGDCCFSIFDQFNFVSVFQQYLNNNSVNYELIEELFDCIIDMLNISPDFTQFFQQTTLLSFSITLMDNEIDSLGVSSAILTQKLIKYYPFNIVYEFLDELYEKILVSWEFDPAASNAISKILLKLIRENLPEDKILLTHKLACKIIKHKTTLQTKNICIKIFTYLLNHTDIFISKFIKEGIPEFVIQLAYQYGPTDFGSEAKRSKFLGNILDFSNALRNNKVNIICEAWDLTYAFIRYCMKESDFAIVIKAFNYLTSMIRDDNHIMYQKIVEDNIFSELFDYIFSENYDLKISALMLIHSVLKVQISPVVYELVIEKQFIQNVSDLLEDDSNEKVTLTLLECIYMIYQASVELSDQDSIPFILEQCNAIEYLQDLVDSMDDDISQHSEELLNIYESIKNGE